MFLRCLARRSPRGRLGPLAPALALAAVLAAPAAHAASFTSVTTAFNAGNSTNLLVDTNPPPVTRVCDRTLGVVSSTANSFQTRYAMLVGTDIGNNATITESFTANYTITLSILGGLGENWQLVLATSRVGALNYPGAGPRTQTLDGHFVTATLIPEPGTAFLLASGLAGLAWSSRRRT